MKFDIILARFGRSFQHHTTPLVRADLVPVLGGCWVVVGAPVLGGCWVVVGACAGWVLAGGWYVLTYPTSLDLGLVRGR